jgi:hypothetical protein
MAERKAEWEIDRQTVKRVLSHERTRTADLYRIKQNLTVTNRKQKGTNGYQNALSILRNRCWTDRDPNSVLYRLDRLVEIASTLPTAAGRTYHTEETGE